MALKLNERYPGRYNNPSADYPQGAFKNRTSPTAKDGSYLEQDWANDKEGFFQSLMSVAGATPNGLVDKVGASQYYDSLVSIINSLVPAQVANGQCRLTFVSATSIKLSPLNGRSLMIGGVQRQIPTAGVTLSNGGLSASTRYFVYAFMAGATMTLEASATGHSQDATTGVEIKTGDATRTLVGMIYTNASSQFADAPATRHVASWFNRRSVGATLSTSVQVGFTNTSFTEVSATYRTSFLTWGDEAVDVKATGQMIHGTAGQSASIQSWVDGVAHGNVSAMYESVSNGGMTFASTNTLPVSGTPLAEGQHIAQVFGAVTAGGGAVTQLANSVMTRI